MPQRMHSLPRPPVSPPTSRVFRGSSHVQTPLVQTSVGAKKPRSRHVAEMATACRMITIFQGVPSLQFQAGLQRRLPSIRLTSSYKAGRDRTLDSHATNTLSVPCFPRNLSTDAVTMRKSARYGPEPLQSVSRLVHASWRIFVRKDMADAMACRNAAVVSIPNLRHIVVDYPQTIR
jgi:hypothetical protein